MSKTLYIIAGEASGDFLGANLIKALKEKDPHVIVCGIGGKRMQEQGLKSLFDMQELSVMGIFEIIPQVFNLLKRINQTVQDIKTIKPDAVICIDSPGFCKRVLNKIAVLPCKKYYYVAPSVWAWRPKRAEVLAKLVDHLFCLFPFEPPYFTKYGLPTTFVGHPLLEKMPESMEKDKDAILLLPGSRRREIKTLLPLFLDVATLIKNKVCTNAQFYLPTLPHLVEDVQEIIRKYDVHIHVVSENHDVFFKKATFALASSGTVSLELCMYQVPHVIAYKVSSLTAFLLRFLIKIPYAALPNILAGKQLVPECIQENCNVDQIYQAFLTLKPETALDLHQTFCMLKSAHPTKTPSDLCADIILEG